MDFFSKRKSVLMDVIRCDEQEYLVWKWRPSGEENSTKKNAIRYSSSLHVKAGEVAFFVYKQKDGSVQDFIVGPYDETIKTANFPVLSSIVGLDFGGFSPFQAEIYFINLSGNIQVEFGIPYFDVFDPRFLDFAVPMAVRGTITFNITDYKGFIKLNRLINFELDDFNEQIKDGVIKYIKGVITNVPSEKGIPVLQIERQLLQINDYIESYLKPRLENDFGVNLTVLDIANIEVDKESNGFTELNKITCNQQSKVTIAQKNVYLKNMQNINARNIEETLRVQREDTQRAQKLQTETNFMGEHALNQQIDVLKTRAESLGNMSNMAQNMNQQKNTSPTVPQIEYSVSINGQTTGPFNIQQMQQMAGNGQITKTTHVWKQGMLNWEIAGNVQELSSIFGLFPPPPWFKQ
jgi:membrane protease subunit (stomatin/prohibitin family)